MIKKQLEYESKADKPVELVERGHGVGRLVGFLVAAVDDVRRNDDDRSVRQRRTFRGLGDGVSQDGVDGSGVAKVGLKPLFAQDRQGFLGDLQNDLSLVNDQDEKLRLIHWLFKHFWLD